MLILSSGSEALPAVQISADGARTWTTLSRLNAATYTPTNPPSEDSIDQNAFPIRVRCIQNAGLLFSVRLPFACRVGLNIWSYSRTDDNISTTDNEESFAAIGYTALDHKCSASTDKIILVAKPSAINVDPPRWQRYRYFMDEKRGAEIETERAKQKQQADSAAWKRVALFFAVMACIALAHGIYLGAIAVEDEEQERLRVSEPRSAPQQRVNAQSSLRRARRSNASRSAKP